MQTPTPTLHVESWQIERLLPYVRNARTHSAVQIRQIAASLAEFGFNNPVLIDAEGSIIAGHGRVLAAGELKLPQVPVIVLSHLTESQKRAFRIADNQLALNAAWDPELLRLELKALAAAAELALDLTGFDPDELARLLAEPETEEELTDPDIAPPPPRVPVTVSAICFPNHLPSSLHLSRVT